MEFRDEKELRNYPKIISYESTEKILEQMRNKICYIKLLHGSSGTGFFCKIPFPSKDKLLPVLVTNNHLIDDKILENKKETIILYIKDSNKYQNFNLNNRKYYTSKEYDITFIEIKENQDEINNFLELDDNILEDILNNNTKPKDNSNNCYLKETIYILQYAEGKLSTSYGIVDNILDIKKIHFSHLCSTKEGSSGSPILNISNNKVFGIHKQASINNNYNRGAFLNMAIKEFINQNIDEKIIFSKIKNDSESPNSNDKKEIKESKEVNDQTKKEIKEKEKIKSMTIKEFNDKYKIYAYGDMTKLNFSHRKDIKNILEVVCNMQIHFYNLKEIWLNNNDISDINILENYQYKKLEILYLQYNQLSDISIFEKVNFPNLKILNLDNNNITDIDVFEKVKFENLEILYFNRNKIEDINVLERVNFPKIKQFYFYFNNISNISVFERVKFENLSYIDLRENNIDKQKFSSLINELKKYYKYFNI